jgi:hypothetical protein
MRGSETITRAGDDGQLKASEATRMLSSETAAIETPTTSRSMPR